jgi:hypothetical protein
MNDQDQTGTKGGYSNNNNYGHGTLNQVSTDETS